MAATDQPVLAVRGVSMHFPSVRALDGVDLDLRAGEVHGIVGENGAGKSTLMKILSGVYHPTAGRLLHHGGDIHLERPIDAQRLGIAMIHQELNLVEELSAADNIFLGRERTHRVLPFFPIARGILHRRPMRKEASQLLRRLECDIDPRAPVKRLSIAQKQLVEIAKALAADARVVIMDEPTAVLTSKETTLLLALIRRLREQGTAIVYISHLLGEVLAICDRITVLRDGKVVASVTPDAIGRDHAGEAKLASLMVGREMANHFPPRPSTPAAPPAPHKARLAVSPEKSFDVSGAPALEVRDFSVGRSVRAASFAVRAGEILAFAGLIGSGRTELAEGIIGLRRSEGALFIHGSQVNIRSPRDAMTHGVAYVSEDRRGRGLTMGMGVVENTTLASLREFSRGPLHLIRRRAELDAAMQHVRAMSIKIGRPRGLVDTLSGGNQQKVAIAKWLQTRPRVLILDEPTRGVDIGAKEEIYRLIRQLTNQGMACVMISSELNEVLGMADRIAVMRNGRIVATLDGATASDEQIMQHAAGIAASSQQSTAKMD